jgi:hypothetical protein
MLTSKIVQRCRAAIISFRIGSELSSIALLESSGTHSRARTVRYVVFRVRALTLYYPRTRPRVISAILVRILADAQGWCMEWNLQGGTWKRCTHTWLIARLCACGPWVLASAFEEG